MQAVGNDFVVVEASAWPSNVDWNAVAIALCDRKFGIGSDGLLLVIDSERADIRMRMFNPDGTEDMCGNGLRCVIRYAIDRGLIRTGAGRAESLDGLHDFCAAGDAIEVAMAPPRFALEDIPVKLAASPNTEANEHPNLGLHLTAQEHIPTVDVINTGSTHAIVWRQREPDDTLFFHVSPLVEHDPAFPERTSVLWAVVEDPDTIRLRIWERGVGETLGCGTGACAAAVLARQSGKLTTDRTRLVSRGGTLIARWSGEADAPVYLAGPAETVYSGFVPGEIADAKS
jgi:diaminopimelate epimerase